MAVKLPKVDDIPADELTPLVLTLLESLNALHEENQSLRDEIARLKGEKGKPDIKPSRLEPRRKKKSSKKRASSDYRRKTKDLKIHSEEKIAPEGLPEGSTFKGYNPFVVQGLRIEPFNTRYLLERWVSPDGQTFVGKLPAELGGSHFDQNLKRFILYQHYHAHVTQPILLEQLRDIGIDISSGQLSNIITEGHDLFHEEKDEILKVGLAVSLYTNVDDTGARHEGINGYCTHIGNELFATFHSTNSKSRVNFLKILCAGRIEYHVNASALSYMMSQELPKDPLSRITTQFFMTFENEQKWNEVLEELGIKTERHIKIITEGALIGALVDHGFNTNLVIVSDDAGQFNVLTHALCWVHAERHINKLVGLTDEQKEAADEVRGELWDLYASLKVFKKEPCDRKKSEIQADFDEIFTKKTCFASLNKVLERIHRNKSELLRVLDFPDIPLHNNLSESDIREYVKRRKISGSTRSELGRKCRDTFTSLKKTCRKQGISFWDYLIDRLCGLNEIPFLPDVISNKAQELYG